MNTVAQTETDWALAKEMVTAISMQRLYMRNEEFSFPITSERIEEIAQGDIELPDRLASLLV